MKLIQNWIILLGYTENTKAMHASLLRQIIGELKKISFIRSLSNEIG
jgi:hypothetical protein